MKRYLLDTSILLHTLRNQGKLKDKPFNNSPRNMGKNDLWIAATASVFNLEQ